MTLRVPRAAFRSAWALWPHALHWNWGPTIIGTEIRVKPRGPGVPVSDGQRPTGFGARPLARALSAYNHALFTLAPGQNLSFRPGTGFRSECLEIRANWQAAVGFRPDDEPAPKKGGPSEYGLDVPLSTGPDEGQPLVGRGEGAHSRTEAHRVGHPGPVNGGRPHLSPGVLQPGPVRSPAAVPENRREGVDASGEPPQGSRGWRVIQRLVGIPGEVPDGLSEPGRVRGYVGVHARLPETRHLVLDGP